MDLATQTGLAFGPARAVPQVWTVNLGAGKAEAEKFGRAMRMTRACVERYRPEEIVIEAAVGGPKASSFLHGLVACVRGEAWQHGVPVTMYHQQSIRKHFLGGNPSKRQFAGSASQQSKQLKALVVNRCRSLGWPVEDDNQADACALWDYAHALRSPAHALHTVGGLL